MSRIVTIPPIPPIPHGSTNEKLIVGRLVNDLLAKGAMLTVNDGEEDTVVLSNDAETIFKALASTDEDFLKVTFDGRRCGWVRLIWGNDCHIISDYTTNLEPYLSGANSLADELEG